MARAIHSNSFLDLGSAGGPDGLLPQHFLDLTSTSDKQGGKDLLQALTEIANFVLGWHVPHFVQPVFFDANLIPLWEKEGGVSPCNRSWPNIASFGCKVCCCAN